MCDKLFEQVWTDSRKVRVFYTAGAHDEGARAPTRNAMLPTVSSAVLLPVIQTRDRSHLSSGGSLAFHLR